ncbi:MAG TPA: hypothetical protein VN911_20935 [Candidatus Acidoferrum sp.]|nr:hypothetical protein [Candidatus Acidoferrum sp.]
MTKNEEKKEIERRVLDAARIAGAPIPNGEVAGEEPDFRFYTPRGVLGLEISEVLKPASSNDGILPAEAEAFHQSIMRAAQEKHQEANAAPTRVSAYFSNPRGKKQGKQQLISSLVQCVAANRERANPVVVLKGDELPQGFDHILITADEPGEWWCGECAGTSYSEIYSELAAKIDAKNPLVSRYRANLARGSQLWLLLFSRVTVARNLPIPAGIGEWKVPFRVDRVFWLECSENKVIEIRRA